MFSLRDIVRRLLRRPRRRHERRRHLRVERLEPRAVPATVATFNVGAVDSAHDLLQTAGPPGPALVSDGQGGRFLRLAPAIAPTNNTVAFALTDPGPADEIVIDFDIRITGAADGAGVVLLGTAAFGATGPVPTQAPFFVPEDPLFPGSFGVGFDLFRSPEAALADPNGNHVSLTWNNQTIVQVDAGNINLKSGQWIHVRVVVRPGNGFSDATVILTPTGGSPVTLIDRQVIPGMTPFESRLWFGARSGGLAADHDIDNVRAVFSRSGGSTISFTAPGVTVPENAGEAVFQVVRTGDLSTAATVNFATANGSATAGADYTVATGTLSFGAGEATRTVRVAITADNLPEGNETFTLTLSGPTGATLGALATATAMITDVTPAPAGRWGPVQDLEIVAIHLHVLPTGDVLYWDRAGQERRWDPVTGIIREAAHPGYDVFCSGHAFLPDGRLLVTGGHPHEGDPVEDGVGLVEAAIYNPYDDSWERIPDMNGRRWYATNRPLPGGDQLVLSGSLDIRFSKNTLPQVWDPVADQWRDLTGANDAGPLGVDLYPRLFIDPQDGRVFKVGVDQQTHYLDTDGVGAWAPGPRSNFGLRTYGVSVEYAPGKILIAGGGDPPTATAEVIDLNEANPTFRVVAPMNFPRRQFNAVVLPDGRVLVVGGSSGAGFNNEAAAVLPAEIWDPRTETFTVVESMQTPRVYHSVASLLPDGRVVVAGGGQGAGARNSYANAEIYEPDYLARGPRPVILSAPQQVSYGATFHVGTADATRIRGASLIALPSVTHAYDMNQRFLPLTIRLAGDGLDVVAPANALRAAPGPYMLFLLDDQGVPSESRILQVVDAAVQFDFTQFAAREGSPAVLTVSRSGDASATLTVPYTLKGESATAGTDFAAAAGTLSWGPGDRTPRTISVALPDDAAEEAVETFTVSLGTPTGGAFLGLRPVTTVTVLDDDSPGDGTIRFRESALFGAEGGTVTVTLTRGGNLSAATTVTVAPLPGPFGLGADTADYMAAPVVVSFAPGQATVAAGIALVVDGLVEGRDVFTVALSGTNETATVEIADRNGSDTEQIVNATYERILGREAERGGLRFWSTALGPAPTHAGRMLLARALTDSLEGRQVQLHRLYDQYVDRLADPAGIAFFAPLLSAGAVTTDEIAAALAGSPEFVGRTDGTAAGFVDRVFRTAVGRGALASDPGFSGVSDPAARVAYALRVLRSTEADRHEVVGYYALGLGLTVTAADPGVGFWAGQLSAGRRSEEVFADILGFLSAERAR